MIQVVILCGGMANRLQPLTDKVAKSMILVQGEPFLEHQLNLLRKYDIKGVVLCVGNFAEQIRYYFGDGKRWGVRLQYSYDGDEPLGTGGALKQAESLLGDVFMVMYGDSYLPFNFRSAIDFFQRFNKLGLMTVYKNQNQIEPSNVEVEGDYVKAYDKTLRTAQMEYIDYGLSIFRKPALGLIPAPTPIDLAYLHQELIKQRELLSFRVKDRFYQIGTAEGLREFSSHIENL